MNEIMIPTPHRIAQNLESIEDMLKIADGENTVELDRPTRNMIVKMLRASASNVLLLFELKADENGEYRLETYGHAWMLADLLRAGDMVPSSYKTDEQVVIGLMKAMEIGVSPISGLSNIMIVNNRPSVWGDLAQAMVQRSDVIANHSKEEIGERPAPGLELKDWPDSYGWRVSFWRKGQESPYAAEYTVADARRAQLWMNTKKLPWITDPSVMLFNRARARALREGFADKLFGMGIIEEQRDFEPIEAPQAQLTAPESGKPRLADDEPVTALEAPGEAMPDYGERREPVETPQEPAQGEQPLRGPPFEAIHDADDYGQPVEPPQEDEQAPTTQPGELAGHNPEGPVTSEPREQGPLL